VVQSDVFELHPVGRDAEVAREAPLEPDRHVAQPQRVVARVQQGLRDEAGRIGEVDEPRPRRADLGGELRELQDDGHGPQGFREPARAGGLLADHVELERDRLVGVAGLVPADPQLHDDVIGAFERLACVARQREGASPAGAPHHALGERADDPQPLRIDVEQRELVHRKAVGTGDEALDQLGRVGAARTHHRDLHTHDSRIVHSAREIVRKVS